MDTVSRIDEFIADPIVRNSTVNFGFYWILIFIFILQKYEKNACVKPTGITIKREKTFVKNESDFDIPFECELKTNTEPKTQYKETKSEATEILKLNEEKKELISELITVKEENQKLFFDVQSKQQKIDSLQKEKVDFQEKINAQEKQFIEMTREKTSLQNKIKQLMRAKFCKSYHFIEE